MSATRIRLISRRSGVRGGAVRVVTGSRGHLRVLATYVADAVSAHPDAIRRRQQAEAERRQRDEERARIRALQQQGVSWWEADCPDNMRVSSVPQDFHDAIATASSSGRLLVVNFFTEECYTCKTLNPKLLSIARSHANVQFLKLNGTDPRMHGLLSELQVDSVPLFNFYVGGQLQDSFTASLSPERLARLRKAITKHGGLGADCN